MYTCLNLKLQKCLLSGREVLVSQLQRSLGCLDQNLSIQEQKNRIHGLHLLNGGFSAKGKPLMG